MLALFVIDVEYQFPVITLFKQWDLLFHSGCVDFIAFVTCELNLAGRPFEPSLELGQMKSTAFILELADAFKQSQQDGIMSPCQSTLFAGRVTEGENVLQGALLSIAQFA